MKKWLIVTATVAVSLSIAPVVSGQIVFDQPPSAGTAVVFTYWKLSSDTDGDIEITQFYSPFSGFLPVRDNLEARFLITSAGNRIDSDQRDVTLNGVGDARLQVSHSFLEDQLLVSTGITLPTGKRAIDVNDGRWLMERLSETFLDFPLRRFGEGFGWNLLVGGARSFSTFNLGGGLSYHVIGAYEPYRGVDDYDPGDFFTANATIKSEPDRFSWSGSAAVTAYQADRLQGAKIFKQSNHLQLGLQGKYSLERQDLIATVNYLLRGGNRSYDNATGVEIERIKLYGNELRTGFTYLHHASETWQVGGLVTMAIIGGNDAGFGHSTVVGLGGNVIREAIGRSRLNLQARYFVGSADDGNIDLTGMQLSAGFELAL